jgi:hypothetical protein
MVKSPGLCSTCSSAPGCSHQASVKGSIFQCEEFSLSPPPPHAFFEGRPKTNGDRMQGGNESEGLCCNCGNRNSCGMRGVDGGVWHCEEYC